MIVPRHLLLRADLKLGNPEARPLGVVEPARVRDAPGGGRHHEVFDFLDIMDQIAPAIRSPMPTSSGVQYDGSPISCLMTMKSPTRVTISPASISLFGFMAPPWRGQRFPPRGGRSQAPRPLLDSRPCRPSPNMS